jgi:hypothetical protein
VRACVSVCECVLLRPALPGKKEGRTPNAAVRSDVLVIPSFDAAVFIAHCYWFGECLAP